MNGMFNDEQLAHAEIVQKETEDALGWWKDRALKAEAALSALSRARETEDGAVREAAERLAGVLRVRRERSGCGDLACDAVTHEAQHLLSALSSPPRPETKDDKGGAA